MRAVRATFFKKQYFDGVKIAHNNALENASRRRDSLSYPAHNNYKKNTISAILEANIQTYIILYYSVYCNFIVLSRDDSDVYRKKYKQGIKLHTFLKRISPKCILQIDCKKKKELF